MNSANHFISLFAIFNFTFQIAKRSATNESLTGRIVSFSCCSLMMVSFFLLASYRELVVGGYWLLLGLMIFAETTEIKLLFTFVQFRPEGSMNEKNSKRIPAGDFDFELGGKKVLLATRSHHR